MRIKEMDYSNIIGKSVKGTIDRPLGSAHPRHKEMLYPINYGYVDGIVFYKQVRYFFTSR